MRENKILGHTLKEIRINCNLKERDVYETIMSRAHLYQIEKNQQMPSWGIVTSILQKFTMSLAEFEYIHNNYQLDSIQQVIQDFKAIKTSTNSHAINALIEKINSLIKNEKNDFLMDVSYVLKALNTFQQEQNFKRSREIVKPVWNRLEKKDAWFYNDLLLITNILYAFDDLTIQHIFERLVVYINKYKNFNTSKELYINIHYNYAICLRNTTTEIDKMEINLKKSKEAANQINDVITVLSCRYYLAEILWHKGNKEKAMEEVKQVFTVLKILEESELLIDKQNDWIEVSGMSLENIF
ncbi:transcriptional activator, Rgg/GadR/MutR family, C-terminal domain [Listeria welshimeri]|nr:transcriptional activator, Rgg/GadR/MutR family, C-terminal domain [Listeria welshimeri]